MTPYRYRDEEPLSRSLAYVIGGAIAGFAAGALAAQRFGGVGGIAERVRERLGRKKDDGEFDESDVYETDEFDAEFDELGVGAEGVSAEAEELEQRVLSAYQNDPILTERPVDIGAISTGIIELTGWVNAEEEAAHAVTIARGVPGVDTVVNRIGIRPRERQFDEFAERYVNGDPALTEGHWEGQSIGTGRRRQGNSSEPDRHEDPRPELAERWTNKDTALAEAADDVVLGSQPTRAKGRRGGRADGSPIAPSGVPKGDHVSEPPGSSPERAD